MPIFFGFTGLLLIIAGLRGTVAGSDPSLVSLVRQDLTGQPNYFEWVIAILMIGALGYIPKLQPLSRAFLTLVIVGLFISNKGFFDQLKTVATTSALTTPPKSVSNTPQPSTQNSTQGGTLV